MGIIELFLCLLFGRFVAVTSMIKEEDAPFSQRFKEFFGNLMPFPFERNFDLTPYDTIFSSWRSQTPDFHMLAEFPPIMNVPRVQVFCDEHRLTVLVDRQSHGVMLSMEEIQLGDGCYSNGEQPNQFVFTYSVNECGTTHTIQNGLKILTNSLHLNLKKTLNWWQTPSTVQLTCVPNRFSENAIFFTSMMPADTGKSSNIEAMNPSWTGAAQSNVYERGQVVNLQVSSQTRPDQRLFIQSCFVSASPEPQAKPRHSLIMNKGCAAPLGSPHPIVQFVASNRGNVVNFVLNTSYLISELYIHCTVLISGQDVTFGSKSCNYNIIKSRWEDLSGDVEVCECCSVKCKGPSVRQLPEDAKATVSMGPLVVVDKDAKMSANSDVPEPQEANPGPPGTGSLQSDAVETDDAVVSATSMSRSARSSPPHGIVVVSHDPVTRLTLWLPGQVYDAEQSHNIGAESDNLAVQLKESDTSDNLPVPQSTSTDQEFPLDTPTNKINNPLSPEMTENGLHQIDSNQTRDELAQIHVDTTVIPQEDTNSRPIIRSKIQFAKGIDGSQTLTYEEEVVKQQQERGGLRCGMNCLKRKQEPRLKGLHSIFLALLRRMNKAE